MPPSLADAARIDEAGPLEFLWRVIISVSCTNVTALCLIEFIYVWNQYLLVLQGSLIKRLALQEEK